MAEISTGYKPRKHQAELHRALKRFNVLVCHRRFGKTVFCFNQTLDKALRNPLRNPQYAYIAPNYGQAKRVAWDMLKEFSKDLPGVTYNEAELRMDIPRPHIGDRLRIMLLGAENPGSLRGLYLDGVILDEYAECDPTVWSAVIRPALSDRLGWAIFIGTPKGTNHFHDIYQMAIANKEHGWFAAIYKASETKVIPQSELDANLREMGETVYAQEFECSFTAALVGAYYGKQMEEAEEKGRIGEVPFDPALQVDTFWDLGIGDTTVIWFLQQLGQQYRLIDYEERSGQGLDYYARILKEGHRQKYNYRDDTWPHDGAARDLGTGKGRNVTWRDLTQRNPIILPRDNLSDGINSTRLIIPKCWFDLKKCERGLDALRNYQQKWDERNKIWQDKPKHDWASHGADGFRTLAMGQRPEQTRRTSTNLQQYADSDYDLFNSGGR